MSKQVLGDTLRLFYPSAQKQNGEHYQKQSLINLRSSINRHLNLPPFHKNWDLMKDPEFKSSNTVFSGNLRMQKDQGLDKTTNRVPLSRSEIHTMYENYILPHFNNDPRCLQHKVCFDLVYYMGRRGKEKLRELKKEWFILKVDPKGSEYFELQINEATKKSQGDDSNARNSKSVMFAIPGDPKCPVASFKLYLSKLTDLPWVFQQANPNYRLPMDPWYKRSPVGVNTIGNFLKEICQRSGIEKHTNHCVRGTTIHARKEGGHDAFETAIVTHHKNPSSINSYLQQPTLKEKKKYSKSLAKFATTPCSSSDDDSDSDFETPPPKAPKNPKKQQNKKKQPIATVSKNKNKENQDEEENNLPLVAVSEVAANEQQNILVPSNSQNQNLTNNYMQMLKQNPVGMFMGANLSNCTININIPK